MSCRVVEYQALALQPEMGHTYQTNCKFNGFIRTH